MKPALLIVEDDVVVSRALRRFFVKHVAVSIAASVGEAKALLSSPATFCGAVIDVALPDGSGMSVLDAFRERWWTAPVLVLTGHLEAALVNRAQAAGAQYAVKPVGRENLEAFARRLVAVDRDAAVGRIILRLAEEHDLTSREALIVGAYARGVPRQEIPAFLDLSENTVKSQIRSLVRKCEKQELSDVARLVWQELFR